MNNKDFFRFKQFTVKHDRCAMKVGTDGVLLGSWASVEGARTALDVGCGCGLIALMLTQRNPTLHIIGIDIDEEAAEQARENIAENNRNDQISIACADFRTFSSESKFDLIISNPPFYKESTTCADESRNNARHMSSLPIERLMERASALLSDRGLISVIVPYTVAGETIGEASMQGLFLSRRTDIKTTPAKPPKRTMLEFCKQAKPTTTQVLTLRDAEGNMSAEYKRLTHDFYL